MEDHVITAQQITDRVNQLHDPSGTVMLEKALVLISRLSGSPDGTNHVHRGAEILAEDWTRRNAAVLGVLP